MSRQKELERAAELWERDGKPEAAISCLRKALAAANARIAEYEAVIMEGVNPELAKGINPIDMIREGRKTQGEVSLER